MNTIFKMLINDLAMNFYKMQGFEKVIDEKYDFSKSKSSREKACWNQAIVAWATIKDDAKALKFQIG